MKGIKRYAVVDAIGLLLGVEAIPASVQDRDGAVTLIKEIAACSPSLSTSCRGRRCNRRLMAHYEVTATIAEGTPKLAMISVMLKRLPEPSLQHKLLSQTFRE